MLPALASLIELQRLDSAAEVARRRLAEFPGMEREIAAAVAAATNAVDAAKSRLADNQQSRRTLEKDVAQVDSRLARFDDHKAAVKTNQEYTALLHEISVAKGEKDAIEEKILLLMEEADVISAGITLAERTRAEAQAGADKARQAINAERATLDAEIARLTKERGNASATVDAALVAKYDQLLKQRRMVAVAPIDGELCTACHVRLRPTVVQQVRRNDTIVYCDSCQRMLYAPPKAAAEAS